MKHHDGDAAIVASPTGRLWTLAEAQAALPEMQVWLQDARRCQQELRDALAQIQDIHIVAGHELDEATTAERDGFAARAKEARQELEKILVRFRRNGVQLKDIETGLLDFYTLMGDEVVFLCWRQGEEAISHWHTLEGGFAGRQEIPETILG